MRPLIRRIAAGVATLRPDDPALAAGLRLSARLDAELHLIHVDTVESPPDRTDLLREVVESVAPGATATGRVVCRVVTGAPERRLVDLVEEADLLVVGATRRVLLAGAILGTTAARVLRSTRTPVLVARGPLPEGALRVLLTTDLSRHAAYAHSRGSSLARALCAAGEPEMRSLFVQPPVLADIPVAHARADLHAEHELAEFLRGEVPPPRSTPCVRDGDPALTIVDEAREWGADLLVLGTHGRRGAARLVLGSVAETVLRHAPCATLLIPPMRPYVPGSAHTGAAGADEQQATLEMAGTA